jgi:Zn-dependent protease
LTIIGLVISFGLLLIAMTVHEFAHGLTAYLCGDRTAKSAGRLTLNPLAHIDPVGTLLIPVVLYISSGGRFIFGAAKPVPVNYWALHDPKKDMFWVGLSGPLSNIIFAFLLSLPIRFLPLPEGLIIILGRLILINLILGFFNLVPIPPLDGSRVAASLLPQHLSRKYLLIEPYGLIIVMALVWGTDFFSYVVWPPVVYFLKLFGLGG